MTYPPGAGPEAAAFSALPYYPAGGQSDVAGGQPDVAPTARARPSRSRVTASVLGGQLVARHGPAPSVGWLVRRITVTASVFCTCRVYIGLAIVPGEEETVTFSGDGDEWDGNQPMFVGPGETMWIAWASATGSASARITYEEVT
jgi:hypothetical protein